MQSEEAPVRGLSPREEAVARLLLHQTAPRGWRAWLRAFYASQHAGVLGLASIVVFMVLWQLSANLRLIDPMFASSPSDVVDAANKLLRDPEVWQEIGATIFEFSVGFVASVLVGIVLGMLMGRYDPIMDMLNPFVSALYATPRIAMLPLIVLWAGIGTESRILLVFTITFLPVIVNTLTGVRVVDLTLIRVARVFGARDLDVFRTVTLPFSVPYILAGLRIAVGQGMIAVIAAEFFIGTEGLGYLLNFYGATFQTSKLMFVVLVTAALGIVVVELLGRIERRFESWRPRAQQ